MLLNHDNVIKWKHFPRYWPFVRGIHRSWGNSPHKGQWRGALMFSLICAWINCWINNREAGDLIRHHAHYDVTVIHVRTIWSLLALYHNYMFIYLSGNDQDCVSTRPDICACIRITLGYVWYCLLNRAWIALIYLYCDVTKLVTPHTPQGRLDQLCPMEMWQPLDQGRIRVQCHSVNK